MKPMVQAEHMEQAQMRAALAHALDDMEAVRRTAASRGRLHGRVAILVRRRRPPQRIVLGLDYVLGLARERLASFGIAADEEELRKLLSADHKLRARMPY